MMIQSLATLLLALQPAPDAEPPVPDWNCDDPQFQQEMNWCAARDYAKADEALNAQWAITSTKMKARDDAFEEYTPPNVDARPGWYASLLQAQRAWITYRDAHCRVDGYNARGGSLEPLLVSSCKTALTDTRTEQLRLLAESPY